ncbi:hypothetical protein AALB53_08335 [Lachnospiraceae bacterium 47-T17]
MYRIKARASDQFPVFLSISASEYVDVILSEGMALFILNTNEIFSMVGLSCVRAIQDTDCSFRISRILLQNLFSRGDFEVSLTDNLVTLLFYDENNAFMWSVECARQMAFDSVYAGKMKLLKEIKSCRRFNSDELMKICKVSKLLGGIVNVDSGVASVLHKLTDSVYKQVSIRETLAFSVYGYETLRKCSHKFFNLHEFIGAEDGNFVILARKCRAESNAPFLHICGDKSIYKAKYVADIDFSNIESFLTSHKVDVDLINVDVINRVVWIQSNNNRYRIPIKICNERVSDGATFSSFELPLRVILKILSVSGIKTARLSKKKNFIELYADDMYILFG